MQRIRREWMAQLRTSQNITQLELAKATGFARNYICQLERGIRGVSVNAAKKIAPVLGIPWTRFFE